MARHFEHLERDMDEMIGELLGLPREQIAAWMRPGVTSAGVNFTKLASPKWSISSSSPRAGGREAEGRWPWKEEIVGVRATHDATSIALAGLLVAVAGCRPQSPHASSEAKLATYAELTLTSQSHDRQLQAELALCAEQCCPRRSTPIAISQVIPRRQAAN